MRDDDLGLVSSGRRTRRLPEQVADHAPAHVFDVHHPLAQIRVVDRRKGLAVFFRDLMENEFDVAPLRVEPAEHLVDQRAVLDDEKVRVENARVVRADRAGDLLLDL